MTATMALATALLAFCAGGRAAVESSSRSWLAQAGCARTFLSSAALMLGSAAGLLALVGVLWQAGEGNRAARSLTGGAVVLEFALALPIAMVLSLIMAQSALLMAGNLCVHYSAYCAARSAIVQIPLPRDVPDDEPANVIHNSYQSRKQQRIRSAALWAVAPICSSSPLLDADEQGMELAEGLGDFFYAHGQGAPSWVSSEYLGRKFSYADQYTDVTIMQRADAADGAVEYVKLDFPYIYAEHEEVRVEVDHVFYLAVPYAARIFAALGGRRGLSFGAGEYGLDIRAACSMTNERDRDYIEVETFD